MSIIGLLFFLFLIIVVLAVLRTYQMEHGEMQEQFTKGTAAIALLDGDYNGIAHGYEGSWKGKTFTRANHRGINRFVNDGVSSTNYPFAFSVGKGLRDTKKDVIVLDYNQAENPWWLKYIIDEMVEISPQTYLGKVHVKITPNIVFTLGYFTLSK